MSKKTMTKLRMAILGLSVFLFLAPFMVGAEPWADPTCAPPNCNTEGPVWVNPDTTQSGYIDLDYATNDANPILNIDDNRATHSANASLYVESMSNNKPAIYGYSTGTGSAYGGFFDAVNAPGLKVSEAYFVGTAGNPTYTEMAGMLYYNTTDNVFKYYDGSDWVALSSPWSVSGDEIYHSLAAGTARGVAIKSGDLTGPNDDYTLDVYRKAQDSVTYKDRAVYGRLEHVSDTTYASGTLGSSTEFNQLIGVKGNTTSSDGIGGLFVSSGDSSAMAVYGVASATGAGVRNWGAFFEAYGDMGTGVDAIAWASGVGILNVGGKFQANGDDGIGVIGLGASSNNSTNYGGYFGSNGVTGRAVYGRAFSTGTNYGGYFEADGNTARGVYGAANAVGAVTNYGGYFITAGNSGVGVYAAGPTTPTTTALALQLDNGAMAMEELATLPTNTANYGKVYVKSSDSNLYFQNDSGTEYNLANGSLWAVSGSEMYHSVAAASATGVAIKSGDLTGPNDNYSLDVYRKALSNSDRAVYARIDSISDSTYASGALGAYVWPGLGMMAGVVGTHTVASTGYGVYGQVTATGAGFTNYGGYFTAAGDSSIGLFADGPNTTTGLAARFKDGAIGLEEISTLPTATSTVGKLYVKSTDSKLYFMDEYGNEYDISTPEDGQFTSATSLPAVSGYATNTGATTNYGGYFTAAGTTYSAGIYASGRNPAVATSYAAKLENGGILMQELSTAPSSPSGYGSIYVSSTDSKLYFKDDLGGTFDLTGGGSGTIEDGTANGQTPFWNNTAGEWQHTETTEMVWDDTNKRFGVGVAAPSYKVHSVTSGATDRAIYGIASGSSGSYGVYGENSGMSGTGVYGTATDTSNPNYGGYFTSAGWGGYGVRASATNTGGTTNYGGYFSASGTSGVGVYGTSSNYAARFNSTGSTGIGVYSTVSTGSASGTSYAGRFETDTTDGRAVYGYATGSGSPNAGYFYLASSTNTGSSVYAWNGSTSASAYAGYFETQSGSATALYASNSNASGYAGYFNGRVRTTNRFFTNTVDSAAAPGFTWYADDDTGLYRVSGGDIIGFTTGGTERMRIDSSGYLGIGGINDTERFSSRLLHVKASDAGTNTVTYGQRLSHFTTGAPAAGFGTGIEFELENSSGSNSISGAIESIWGNATWGAEDGELIFKSRLNGTLTEAMRIDDNGYLGIGLTNPNEKLTVEGALSLDKIAAPSDTSGYGKVYVNSTDNKLYFKDGVGGTFDLTATGGSGTIADGDTDGQMAFWNETLGTWEYTETSELVWDDSEKSLGIGFVPSGAVAKLYVKSNALSNSAIIGESTNASGTYTYGGTFTSWGSDGIGASGFAYGVSGRGIQGIAGSGGATDTNYGGYFTTDGGRGVAVRGIAYSTDVTNAHYGAYFTAASGNGIGLYSSGAVEAARFEGSEVVISNGTENINYATSAGELYVSADIEADGVIYGGSSMRSPIFYDLDNTSYYLDPSAATSGRFYGNLQIGYGLSTDNDYIYFDQNSDYLMWDNTNDRFSFSDDLAIDYNMYIGHLSSADDDYLYFSAGNESLMWNATTSGFELSDDLSITGNLDASGSVISLGNFYIDNDFNSSYDYLYFGGTSATSDYIRYYDVNDTFGFSGSVATISRGTAAAPAFSFTIDEDTGMYSSTTNTLNFTTAGTESLRLTSTGLVQAVSLGSAAAPVFSWTGDTNTGIYSSGADTINFTTGGTLAMTVGSTGNVTVAGNINSIGSGGTVYGNGTGNFGLYSNRIGSDGNLLRFDRDGSNVGLITVASGTITYGTFTGSHYVLLEDDNIERGHLIHLTGNNSYKGENETGEIIYGAKISETANDPAIIGSYFSIVEDGDGLSWAQAVGNGDMWVVDNGSDLQIGDYLISSDVAGHAMKVTDDYRTAYVVARVAENVDWSKVEEKTYDGIRHKKISVFFESFILNNSDQYIKILEERINKLEAILNEKPKSENGFWSKLFQ